MFKPLIGVQGSTMGWNDPWHCEESKTKMRTGEGIIIPSPDYDASPDEFIDFIKKMGADLYIHHSMPGDSQINKFLEDIESRDINFIIGNEYGNINGPFTDFCNRYDIPKVCVERAKVYGDNFKGLLYDEPEHLQFHPDQYLNLYPEEMAKNLKRHQWTGVLGKSIEKIKSDIISEAQKLSGYYGNNVSLYNENVFPVMYHLLARGGFNPCPKIMKEEFTPVQISSALGAAVQYKRKFGICVDLWGPDIGAWFTRTWAFPGHSPEEFESALKIAYLMSPDFMFVENADALGIREENRFRKTEFGEVFEKFTKKFIPENPLYYTNSMATPDIVMIRSDDCDFSAGMKLFGSGHLVSNEMTRSPFEIFHILSHRQLPLNGLTYFLPQFEYFALTAKAEFEGKVSFPLKKGFNRQTKGHNIFYPMNNLLVMDENVTSSDLGQPSLIFLAGSVADNRLIHILLEKCRNGAVCIIAKWLLKDKDIESKFHSSCKEGKGIWMVTDSFLSDDALLEISKFSGDKNTWTHKFGEFEIIITNPSEDKITIEHEIRSVE